MYVIPRPFRTKQVGNSYICEEIPLDTWDKCEKCLIEAFVTEQAKRHPNLRSNACLISCPCRRCNPATM
jgi:hypothetical protein